MCAERRIYTHITSEESRSGEGVEPKGAYFLYCDPLLPNNDSRTLEAAAEIRPLIEEAVATVLGAVPEGLIDRAHLVTSLEHAARALLASIERGRSLVAGSALILCHMPPKEPHFTETLIAGAGECRVYGVRDDRVDLIFCDPFHEDTPPGLTTRERYTVSTNILGLETDLDVHVRRLRQNSYHSLIIANYPAYSFLSQEDLWKTLRGRYDSVATRAQELFAQGAIPEGAELIVISKQAMAPVGLPADPPKAALPSKKLKRNSSGRGRRSGRLLAIFGGAGAAVVLALIYHYLNTSLPEWNPRVALKVAEQITTPQEKLDSPFAAKGEFMVPSREELPEESAKLETWEPLELQQLEADISETKSIVERIHESEHALSEVLHARDSYVADLEQRLQHLQMETPAAHSLVDSLRDDKIADLQYVADSYLALRERYDQITSLLAEDARRTEELQKQLDAQALEAEQIQAEAYQQQEELLSLHEMLAEAEERCAERDGLILTKNGQIESLMATLEEERRQGLDRAGQRLLSAQEAQLHSLQATLQQLSEKHQKLSEDYAKIQLILTEQADASQKISEGLAQEQEKHKCTLDLLDQEKSNRHKLEQELIALQNREFTPSDGQEASGEIDKRLELLQSQLRQERQMRQNQESMLRRLSQNVGEWRRAFQQLEQSREELASELSELRAPQTARVAHYRLRPSPDLPKTRTRIHLVSPGDTLASIAQSYYNSVEEAAKILQANREKISDPDDLRVGTALVVP